MIANSFTASWPRMETLVTLSRGAIPSWEDTEDRTPPAENVRSSEPVFREFNESLGSLEKHPASAHGRRPAQRLWFKRPPLLLSVGLDPRAIATTFTPSWRVGYVSFLHIVHPILALSREIMENGVEKKRNSHPLRDVSRLVKQVKAR